MVSDDAAAVPPPNTALNIVVAVVDSEAPQLHGYVAPHWTNLVAGTAGSSSTVLGVSAGVATAEQIARVAASAAVAGHEIVGILVADPDPADSTTGRLPQVSRPTRARRPNRMTGTATEINP